MQSETLDTDKSGSFDWSVSTDLISSFNNFAAAMRSNSFSLAVSLSYLLAV